MHRNIQVIILFLFLISNFVSAEYTLPDSIFFAGKRVPIESVDVYDRLEQIFNVLVYDRRGKVKNLLSKYPYYIPKVQKILNDNDLHEDFAFVMVVESGLTERINSSAKASGPWQFIKTTAVRNGLRVDKTCDERNLLDKSTIAAAKYFKSLLDSRLCDGDVFLALAAYNNGEGNLKKMLQAQGCNSFWEAVSNSETSDYVPRVVVYKEILSNPEKYGFDKPKEIVDDELYELFSLRLENKRLSFKTLSSFLDISYREFYQSNPHLRHKSYKQGGFLEKFSNLDIRIPVGKADVLFAKLETDGYQSVYVKNEIVKREGRSGVIGKSCENGDGYLIHTVNESTLGEIAFNYKMDWHKIAKDNNLIIKKRSSGVSSAVIFKGQKLKIYTKNL